MLSTMGLSLDAPSPPSFQWLRSQGTCAPGLQLLPSCVKAQITALAPGSVCLHSKELLSKALPSPNLRTTKPMWISDQQRAAGGPWVQKMAQAQAAASIMKKLSLVTLWGPMQRWLEAAPGVNSEAV